MTETDLCNLALGNLGHDRVITALDDGSAEAARCALFLPRARLQVLGAHDWGFLIQGAEDPMLKGRPCADGRRWTYARPFEALRVVTVEDAAGNPVRYGYSGSALLAYAPEVRITYTLDNDQPDDWPAKVQEAVAWQLAARLAGPLTGKQSTMQAMMQAAMAALLDAKAADCNETRDKGEPGNRYADARG